MRPFSCAGRPSSAAAALFAMLLWTSPGCTSDRADPAAGSPAGETGVFEGAGRLRTVPPGGRFVRLEHGDIPGFMSAMTMAFELADTTLLQNVAVGDSVRFEVTLVDGAAVVTALEPVPDPSDASRP